MCVQKQTTVQFCLGIISVITKAGYENSANLCTRLLGPGMECGVSHNDPDALQDHCGKMFRPKKTSQTMVYKAVGEIISLKIHNQNKCCGSGSGLKNS